MQIFIGSTSLDVIDLYPDDLLNEWRFDYYYNAFDALKLDCDTDEDLDEILESIEDEFQLVIEVTHNCNVKLLLEKITPYKDKVVLMCDNIEQIKLIKEYRYSIATTSIIKGTQTINILDNFFTYNALPVIQIPKPDDEMHMRAIIEELLALKTDVILLVDSSDSETLDKIKIIIDLLISYK